MTNRLQDATIDRLALERGRVAVRDGFADGHVDVTAPSGACWRVLEDGTAHKQPGGNYSINWND